MVLLFAAALLSLGEMMGLSVGLESALSCASSYLLWVFRQVTLCLGSKNSFLRSSF